ncbi:ATP-binding protein [Microbacterium sp. NPDC019599]|uniref:ATP-binding protein n=1 Tax=Microbacterium sp. NPDC019599 TaxID=3154690 RepID=UPI0033D46E7A
MAFLRNALIVSLDEQLQQLTSTDVAVNAVLEIEVSAGDVSFKRKPDAATDYFVAIYGPEGDFIISAGGDEDAVQPDYPETITLQRTQERGLTPFEIPGEDGGSVFHASTDVLQPAGASALYTQLVAMPIAPINRVVTTYLGIYSILALITIIAGALLTRWLVTLTFRSLGQVESTAMTIAAGDFGQRMTDIEPTTTEVGRLKTAINAMLDRIDGALSQRDATVRQMRRFIGDASHELRTPLVTVRGYAELYRMGAIDGDDDVAQAMDRIESEAKRMGLLVEDLLALARLDERRDVVIAPVDLRPVARDAAMDVRAASPHRPVTVIDTTIPESRPASDAGSEPLAPEPETPKTRRGGAGRPSIGRAGGTLSLLRRRPKPVPAVQTPSAGPTPPVAPVDLGATMGDPATPPLVLGDENRIRQVVANLLGNARRFTSEDSPIELRIGIDPSAETGWIEVIDHGEGVPDQIKEKIFQRFWRADTSRARETGGTGLGLSIVASIVEALHGGVDVVDTPGGGATFRVALPLAMEAIAAERASFPTQPIPRLRHDA